MTPLLQLKQRFIMSHLLFSGRLGLCNIVELLGAEWEWKTAQLTRVTRRNMFWVNSGNWSYCWSLCHYWRRMMWDRRVSHRSMTRIGWSRWHLQRTCECSGRVTDWTWISRLISDHISGSVHISTLATQLARKLLQGNVKERTSDDVWRRNKGPGWTYHIEKDDVWRI